MIDALHALQQRPEFGAVVDVAAGEEDDRGEARGVAGREIVEAAHRMPVLREAVGERRAQKSGGARD